MNPGCPNKTCKVHLQTLFQKKDGHYYREDDAKYVQRFQCKICKKKYSTATFKLEFRQKKRRWNSWIRRDYTAGKSINRMADHLRLHPKTIERKIQYLAEKARRSQKNLLQRMSSNRIQEVQFDDLIASVHTKLKPVSISVVIDPNQRVILGAKVAEIPAFGKIAEISKRKYGRRQNLHPVTLNNLLSELQKNIAPDCLFKTDEHKRYPEIISKNFPRAQHLTHPGKRATVAGFGEMKQRSFDPLFQINQILAMFRANMNRLFRRSWNTSKRQSSLQDHVDIFVDYFNEVLRLNVARCKKI
jgi:transposase-like protein